MAPVTKPRVFLSSVVDGFEQERQVSRSAVLAAGCDPILVNEDFPSLPVSSRNACLDAVESCDAFLLVVGARGGWLTPSGLLVVEEEYHHARSLGLPVVVVLAETDRDPQAARFVEELSDYVSGHFRRTYRSLSELAQVVEDSAREIARMVDLPFGDLASVEAEATREPAIEGEASVRLVVASERDEEVIDPARLQSREFRELIYRVGHDPAVGLFDFERRKNRAIEGDFLVVTQTSERRSRETVDDVQLKVGERGTVVVEANATGWVCREAESHGTLDSFVIAYEDIVARLETSFRFVASLMGELDRYERHQRFTYQVTLLGVGYRTLEKSPRPRNSYTLRSVFGEDRPIVVLPQPRVVPRGALVAPAEEIRRVMALLERRLEE